MATSVSRAIMMASCPAPLGRRTAGRAGHAFHAGRQQVTQPRRARRCRRVEGPPVSALAAGADGRSRRSRFRSAPARGSSAHLPRSARRWTGRSGPGITLMAPSGTRSCPTVPTTPGSAPQMASTCSTISAAPRGSIAPSIHRHGAGMAGKALHRQQQAPRAGDARHHAEGMAAVQQHRTLLDVHLDESQRFRRIAGQRGDPRGIMPRSGQRGCKRAATGIRGLQQARIEAARHRAAAQEGGAEAQPFLVAERDDFDGVGQRDLLAAAALRARQSAAARPRRPS